MRWGFNRSIGPFQAWDAIGLRESVERMKADGHTIPANIEEMLAKGNESFYKEEGGVRYQYDLVSHEYTPIAEDPKLFHIPRDAAGKDPKSGSAKVAGNDSATLWDMGDGVLLYEMHTPKANAISDETIEIQNKGIDLLEAGKYTGMVLGNESDNFCVGANLFLVFMAVQGEQFEQVEKLTKAFQDANMRMKYCSSPIVAAPVGYTFGGGCELAMHCHQVVGAAESYIGLVEVGVGLIPGGGGTKELTLRATENLNMTNKPSLLPFVQSAFENIAKAEVATSFKAAQDLGLLRSSDKMVVNADYRLTEAKAAVLGLAATDFDPGRPRDDIPVVGESGTAAFMLAVESMKDAGWASEHDQLIANKVAYIIGGGQRAEGQTISEQELLDLEREAFMSLLGEPKTLERISYMLQNNKPLRN